jgi:hypothetical protein
LPHLNNRSRSCPHECGDLRLMLNCNIHNGAIPVDMEQDAVHLLCTLSMALQLFLHVLNVFCYCRSRVRCPVKPLQFLVAEFLPEVLVCSLADFHSSQSLQADRRSSRGNRIRYHGGRDGSRDNRYLQCCNHRRGYWYCSCRYCTWGSRYQSVQVVGSWCQCRCRFSRDKQRSVTCCCI